MAAEETKTILVVDDDQMLVDTVRSILEIEGYSVETAYDGAEALERVAQHMPDLILLDMKMPRIDGPTFAEKFRGQYGYKVPVIGFTATADCDGYAQEVWANGWLGKPFTIDDLVKIIRRHTHHTPSRR